MDEKLIKPTHITLIKPSSDQSVKPDKQPNNSFSLPFLVQALASLRQYWKPQLGKRKRLSLSCSGNILGLITLSEKSLQVTLNKDILSASTDAEFQFQEIPWTNESTSPRQDTSNAAKR